MAYILDERSYEIVFYALFPSGHFFIQYGLYKAAFSTYFFGKTRFLSVCILVFPVSVSLAFAF